MSVMSIKIIIKKVKRNLNDFGVLETLEKGIRYLFRKLYLKNTYLLYRRDLRGEQFPETCLDGVVLRFVENTDTQALRQIEDMVDWLQLQGRLREIISRGFCVAAFDGPRVVGFNLVDMQEVSITALNIKKRILPHHAWSVHIAVLKADRKKGLASAIRYRVFAELQKRGVRTFYGGAMVSNATSLKFAEKVGFQPVANIQYLKVLNRERRIWTRLRHW